MHFTDKETITKKIAELKYYLASTNDIITTPNIRIRSFLST